MRIDGSVFEQQGFRCRLEWGRRGAQAAADRGDILVIVDTLRFSTTVVTAVHHGVTIFPCAWNEDPIAFARRVDAVPGGQREGEDRRFTLSPLCYLDAAPGTRVALASPNGATCARYAHEVPYLFIGTLINAQAVGRTVTALLHTTELNVTVLACGERWWTPSEDGELRFAVEDYLGAGAILAYLSGSMSPEAAACRDAFSAGDYIGVASRLETILLECGSGRELQAKGRTDDVRHAARLNLYDTVPTMRGEQLAPV
jgi:2-phosphosulfolactate phosphatase